MSVKTRCMKSANLTTSITVVSLGICTLDLNYNINKFLISIYIGTFCFKKQLL